MIKKLTICIPAYNSEKTIEASVRSAMMQNYKNKKVVVFDDCSSDNTRSIARKAGAQVVKNEENLGIGKNIEKCFNTCKTSYIMFLCSDDIFADENVAGDVVSIFHHYPNIGVIARYYYQFMNGDPKPVSVYREKNILISSCNPSGMAFRKQKVEGTNEIFIEMPSIVKRLIEDGWGWTMMEYDTVAVRLHRGGNTGTFSSYYKNSPVKVWSEFLEDKNFKYHPGLIQLKNCAPKLLWKEICMIVKINPKNLYDPMFWFCSTVALVTPRFILKRLCDFYRVNIMSKKCKIIKRGGHE